MRSKKHKDYEVTTDNIFADLGLKNSEDLKVRSDLLSQLAEIVQTNDLSQKEIAEVLGISQFQARMLVSGKLSAFSADTLKHYVEKLF